MMKSILSILVALFAAVIVIYIVESFSHMMYAMPEGMDLQDKQAMEDWIRTLPFGAMVLVLLAWFSGATVGGFIASFMDRDNAMRSSMVVGMLLLIITLVNLFEIPHPVWMWVGGIIAIASGTWIGQQLFFRRHRRSE